MSPGPWQHLPAVGLFAGLERGEAAAFAPSPWPIAARSLQDNGYVRLLRRQVEEVFRDNRMIAICQYNSMPDEDVVMMRHYLRKHNIEVKFVLNEIARPVLSQSKYKNLLPLFVARNILLVSREAKVKEMLRVLKGVPQVNLLGESLPCISQLLALGLGLLCVTGERCSHLAGSMLTELPLRDRCRAC